MNTESTTERPNPKRKLFFGLFLFPLLIAVGMAALLCTVVFLTHEEQTPETLIAGIKTGSPSRRWASAYELSMELNRRPEMIRSGGVRQEIIHILSDPDRYDVKTRSYMAMALSRFKEPEAVAILRERLGKEEPEVQLHLIWALGNLGAREAAGELVPFLSHERGDLRKMAAYVLGVLGDAAVAPDLKPLLEDPVTDVSWNAALSLARLGDDSGREVLLKMLDRNILAGYPALTKEETELVMVNAIRGLAQLGPGEDARLLESLSRTDESLRVRQAALEALKRIPDGSPRHG